ncbi:MAG TPA: aminoglycoside phosphotransferase family protein [Saprospiraceae bacterium]|nr:aminoglycoside phosphotransferase family protein [Saprospiraceae bacterium]
MIFQANPDYPQFSKLYQQQPENWREAAIEIAKKHNIVVSNFDAYPEGSNLVATINEDLIIKIFPPIHFHQWESEHKTLGHLQDKLKTAIPVLITFGVLENNWTYAIITKLEGRQLESVWSNCTIENKQSILTHIGKLIKEVHSLEFNELSDLKPAWNEFIKDQLFKYKERHIRNGMSEWFLSQVENYVNSNIQLLPKNPELVILTGEFTPFNLLVERDTTNWIITGMIDFGDSMIGFNEYDLIGPLLFLCAGNKESIQTLLSAYGYSEKDFTTTFRKRLLLLTILHRYSNLNLQIRIPDWQDKVSNFDELEQIIWPL